MMRILISDDAVADLQEGWWFYEVQERGLGDYFVSSLRADIESLRISAGIHRRPYQDYHRMLCRAFPYAVFYTFESKIVTNWAVVDCRRDPDWIRQHLGE